MTELYDPGESEYGGLPGYVTDLANPTPNELRSAMVSSDVNDATTPIAVTALPGMQDRPIQGASHTKPIVNGQYLADDYPNTKPVQ